MKRFLVRLSLVVVAAFGLATFYDVQQAAAVGGPCWFRTTAGPVTGTGGCGVSGYGDYGTHDVLTGRSTSGAGAAIPAHVNTKNEFINFVKSRYRSGTHNKVGAAFIMQTMRGDHRWPTNADIADWEARMRQPDVTVQRYSVSIHRSSWYDPGKHNTFFASYSPGNRMSIIVKYKGSVRSVIETGCGNLANTQIPLPNPEFKNEGKSDVSQRRARPGDRVRFTHEVRNVGDGDMESRLNVDVYMRTAGATTKRFGCDEPRPGLRAGQRTRGCAESFRIPANARDGQRFCEFIRFSPRSSDNSGEGRSSQACVEVRVRAGCTPPDPRCTPGGGTDTATCQPVTLNRSGIWEVHSVSYQADYQASVSTTRSKPNDRGGWGNESDTRQRQTEKRYRYEMKDAQFESDHGPSSDSGKSTISSNPHPGTPATGRLPANSETKFDYEWEEQPGEYTVDGDFEATIVEVEETYERFRTRSKTAVYTRDSNGNRVFSHWSYGSWRSPGGWSLSGTDKTDVGAVTAHCDESPKLTYAYRPYMTVYGDTLAGAYQADVTSSSCASDSSAGIYGWNHNDGVGDAFYHDSPLNDFAGAGAEAGAFALANIKLFSSALNHGGVAPTGLSFANSSANPASGDYGGSFGNLPVACDFVPEHDEAATSGFPSGGNSAYSDNETYVINGSVTISGDIIYANNGGWAGTTDIPRLKLVVVGGDIRINGSVSQLDGMYVAIPSAGGSGGHIYTCLENNYADCNNQLTVYGSFVAKKIHFGRTSGTLHEAKPSDDFQSSPAGENFIYTPELWLPAEAGRDDLEYDSIQGLPPVL